MKLLAFLREWWARRRSTEEQRRAREELLSTPGVDYLVRDTMDNQYGYHNWRVKQGVLQALVRTRNDGTPWWGTIGKLGTVEMNNWIARTWAAQRGLDPPSDYNPRLQCPECNGIDGRHTLTCPALSSRKYRDAYADTTPGEDDDPTNPWQRI